MTVARTFGRGGTGFALGFSESMELPLGLLDAINEATDPFRVRGVMER